MAIGTTLSIASFEFIFDRFIDAKLQTAVEPSIFSFSTIYIGIPPKESKAVTFLAGFVIPLSSVTSSSSS